VRDSGIMPRMTSLESLVANMSVAELAARAGITVARLVELASGSRPAAPASNGAPKRSTDVPRGGLSPDTVLAALAAVGTNAKLEDVRAKTGGTVPQVRAALQKLAGAKKVRITGQRRGTRYTAS
jgi:hypothetical protein